MDKNIAILDSLPSSDVFAGLTTEQNDVVTKHGLRKKLPSKKILFHQGASAQTCYLVNRGRLKLTKLNEQGKEVIFRYVSVGELTGAVAVLKNRDYPVTAECVEETVVTGWDKQTMMYLMRRYPDITINLLGIILERLDDVQNRYLELSTERVERRIALTLLRLMRSAGLKTPEGIYIDIPLGRQNIADYSGTTLFTVSRTLSTWEKKGWIKSGAIKRFVVMAGCDGRQKSRNYYTEVAENLPKDTVILTAGCAKYRYNKLALGDIGGIPRVLDAGQCNDSYSLAVIALKLKEVFGLEDINDLPISYDIAWYEQKAVAVLLALLFLGVKGIRLGPTLPAFLSPNVAKVLVEKFDIKPIGTVEEDIAAMMAGN